MSSNDGVLRAEWGRRLVDEYGAVPSPVIRERALAAIGDLALAIAAEGYDFRDALVQAMHDAERAGADALMERAAWDDQP